MARQAWAQRGGVPETPQALNRYAYARNNPLRYTDPAGHWIESALDIAFIAYDFYDISQNGLTWENGLALAADVGGLVLPGLTGGGALVRAVAHADDVANAVRTATRVDDAASAARMASLGWGNGSSEALRANLKAAGLQPPPFRNAAHHIVAHTDLRARPSQEHLAQFGIHADDAVNGVFLRIGPRGEGLDHRIIHTDMYYEEVNRRVLSGTTREEVMLILRDIADELRNETFPYR